MVAHGGVSRSRTRDDSPEGSCYSLLSKTALGRPDKNGTFESEVSVLECLVPQGQLVRRIVPSRCEYQGVVLIDSKRT